MIACSHERTVVKCDVCRCRVEVLLPMPRRHALRELRMRGWGERRIGRQQVDQVCPRCAEQQEQTQANSD